MRREWRFRTGISTAGVWYRCFRKISEMKARKQAQPSRSKLDTHKAFILGLIREAPDFPLAEGGKRGVRVAPSTVSRVLTGAASRSKKDSVRL